ncbi:hypothetical protein [Streptococcus equi]|uniref:hypothetical protein n=1 Tax=Streptococcus equi TaxID=1336 RepID=UPI0039C72E96
MMSENITCDLDSLLKSTYNRGVKGSFNLTAKENVSWRLILLADALDPTTV